MEMPSALLGSLIGASAAIFTTILVNRYNLKKIIFSRNLDLREKLMIDARNKCIEFISITHDLIRNISERERIIKQSRNTTNPQKTIEQASININNYLDIQNKLFKLINNIEMISDVKISKLALDIHSNIELAAKKILDDKEISDDGKILKDSTSTMKTINDEIAKSLRVFVDYCSVYFRDYITTKYFPAPTTPTTPPSQPEPPQPHPGE